MLAWRYQEKCIGGNYSSDIPGCSFLRCRCAGRKNIVLSQYNESRVLRVHCSEKDSCTRPKPNSYTATDSLRVNALLLGTVQLQPIVKSGRTVSISAVTFQHEKPSRNPFQATFQSDCKGFHKPRGNYLWLTVVTKVWALLRNKRKWARSSILSSYWCVKSIRCNAKSFMMPFTSPRSETLEWLDALLCSPRSVGTEIANMHSTPVHKTNC